MLRREFIPVMGFLSSLPKLVGCSGAPSGRVRTEPLLSAPRLDAHVHLRSPKLVGVVTRNTPRKLRLEPVSHSEVVAELDARGIDEAFALSTAFLFAADNPGLDPGLSLEEERKWLRNENDFAMREVARSNGRLHCFVSVNPKRPDAAEEVERCAAKGAIGVKLLFWESFVDLSIGDDLTGAREVFDAAASNRMCVLVHAFNGDVRGGYRPSHTQILVEELITPFTDLRVAVAHAGGAGGFGPHEQAAFTRLVELMPKGTPHSERTFIDLTAVLTSSGHPEWGRGPTRDDNPKAIALFGSLVERWGVQRVLWGSDNDPTALDVIRANWPLTSHDWNVLASQRASALL